MKKVLFFLGCTAMVAALSVSCGNKNTTEEAPEAVVEEAVEETTVEAAAPVATEACSEAATTNESANDAAMLAAAREAGQAKCNCYKTDAASVEACIRSIISSQYAAYEGNDAFKAAMEEEYQQCIKDKVKAAATEKANEGIKAGAKALSGVLNKNK
ncbi:MAG: hypothetical protein IJV22_07475 [Bacteroidales bacterium]|nr:hypothetical protein [Bacteroidales bacterium]